MSRDLKAGRDSFLAVSLALLLINSAYLAAFATPSVFYFANVGLHIVAGLACGIVMVRRAVRRDAAAGILVRLSGTVLAAWLSSSWAPRAARAGCCLFTSG
jgi:hypothetical protein